MRCTTVPSAISARHLLPPRAHKLSGVLFDNASDAVYGAQGEAALSVLSSTAVFSAAPLSNVPTSTPSPSPSPSPLLLSCGQCDSSALTSYSSTHREIRSLYTSAVRMLMRDGDRWSAAQRSTWQTGRVLLVNKLPLPSHCALFVKTIDKRASTTAHNSHTAAATTHTTSERSHGGSQSQSASQRDKQQARHMLTRALQEQTNARRPSKDTDRFSYRWCGPRLAFGLSVCRSVVV